MRYWVRLILSLFKLDNPLMLPSVFSAALCQVYDSIFRTNFYLTITLDISADTNRE